MWDVFVTGFWVCQVMSPKGELTNHRTFCVRRWLNHVMLLGSTILTCNLKHRFVWKILFSLRILENYTTPSLLLPLLLPLPSPIQDNTRCIWLILISIFSTYMCYRSSSKLGEMQSYDMNYRMLGMRRRKLWFKLNTGKQRYPIFICILILSKYVG